MTASQNSCSSSINSSEIGLSSPPKLESFFHSPISNIFFIVIIVILNLACYYRTISGYFLADDFVHVSYLANVISHHPEKLLLNFVSNWMQAYGTTFYRPLISLSLALDYWLGNGNPIVFHISNTLYQILCATVLFLLTKRIMHKYSNRDACLAAFFAAALFSVFPLHPEVVSWVIGRVDSLCTLFYLTSFWLYVVYSQNKNIKPLILSIAAFILSLTSKEMSVTLPLCLFLFELFSETKQSLIKKIYFSLKKVAPYFIVLAVYFLVRYLALGQVVGGYTGSIGEGLSQSVLNRWFNFEYLSLVLFPFNAEIFTNYKLAGLLGKLYLFSALLFIARFIFFGKFAFNRWLIFSILWFIVAMLPTYQVWNLTSSLQGGRFIYLGSAPLCLILPFLFFPLKNVDPSSSSPVNKIICWLSISLLCALVGVFGITTYKNNLSWAHASKETRAFRQAVEDTLRTLPENKKLVILNIPQRREGAHMLYNAAMASVLLSPPLSSQNLSKRIVTFEPVTYGDSDLINASRLRQLLVCANDYAVYKWNSSDNILLPLSFTDKAKIPVFDIKPLNENIAQIQQVGPTLHISSPEFSISSTAADFIIVKARCSDIKTNIPVRIWLSWSSEKQPNFIPQHRISFPFIADGQAHTYTFAVSEHKSWIDCEKITQLDLEFPFLAKQNLNPTGDNSIFAIEELAIVNGNSLIPRLSITPGSCVEAQDGVNQSETNTFGFSFDASNVKQANKVIAEISKPNSWFEHYSGTYKDNLPSRSCLHSANFDSLKGSFQLAAKDFPEPAYYQIRIFALDKDGNITGYSSDPINIQVSVRN